MICCDIKFQTLTNPCCLCCADDPEVEVVTVPAESSATSIDARALDGTLSGPSGTEVLPNRALPLTIIESKLAKETEVASRDLKKEWASSKKEPIEAISKRFGHAKTGKHYVTVCPHVVV